MRLLYVEQAVPKAVVSSWVNSHTVGSSLSQANTALSDLGVWQEASMPGGLPAWILKNTFRQNLKIVLTGGEESVIAFKGPKHNTFYQLFCVNSCHILDLEEVLGVYLAT